MSYVPDKSTGLSLTGVYTANGSANYISSATSLQNADNLLDTALHNASSSRSTTNHTFVQASNGSTQSITVNTNTLVSFPTLTQDMLGEFSTSTNLFTSKSAQVVLVTASVTWQTGAMANRNNTIYIYKNGSSLASRIFVNNTTVGISTFIELPILLAVNDNIEIYVSTNDSSTRTISSQSLVISQLY